MKNGFLKRVLLLTLFCAAFTGAFLLQEKKAYATATPTPIPAGPVNVVAVEYYEEQIVVKNNGNSQICFASEVEAAKDNWEVVNADSGNYTIIDMSWLSTTVENIIMIKGAQDTTNTKSRIIMKEKPLKLEVNISYENIDTMNPGDSIAPLVNIMSNVGSGSDPVDFSDLEWRKGTTGQWESTKTLNVAKLEKYLIKGTYLYFRIRAVDAVVKSSISGSLSGTEYFDTQRYMGLAGFSSYLASVSGIGTDYPDGTEGRRFSNEIKVKIAKKATASNYTIDGEKFTAEIKYGKEYRVTVGTAKSDWVQVTDRATKSIDIKTIVAKAVSTAPIPDGSTAALAFPAMKLEVRDYASTKAASSKITEITVNQQRTITSTITAGPAPATAILAKDPKIYVSYNGNKNMVLEIPLATTELPYEYCVVKSGETYDVTKAVWAAVTKGTAVKILSSKAVEGGTLYIRQREIRKSNSTVVTLASTYAACSINYPSIPVIAEAEYTFTKGGYSGDITFAITMNESGKTPYETAVKNIKLGTKLIDFTPVSTTTGGIQTIQVTLKKESLSTLVNCYRKAITITFEKGTVDKTSILLTIQSPTTAGTLTLTNAKGTNTGTTAFTMVSSKGIGNSWFYTVTAAAIENVNNVDTIAKVAPVTIVAPTTFTTATMDNVTVADGQYLTIFEVNTTNNIVRYKSIKITADYIK